MVGGAGVLEVFFQSVCINVLGVGMKTRMRIAFVAFSVGTGMGPLIMATCAALRDRFDIRLFVPQHYCYSHEDVPMTRLSTANKKYARGLSMLTPASHRMIWNAISEFNPDLVHIFNGHAYPWSYTLLEKCAEKKIPTVVTVHDPQPHPGKLLDLVHDRLGTLTASKASVVHLFNRRFIDYAKERYERPVCFADYINIAQFYLMHKSVDVAREKIVLQFGRLEYYKGIDLLVDASAFLPRDWKVIIAGPGRLTPAVRTKTDLDPDRFEIYEGYLPDEMVARLFQRAQVQALPYRDVTQSQLHVIGAEFGVVTVATDSGFFHDQVPRFNGVVVDTTNPEKFAKAILLAADRSPVIPRECVNSVIVQQYEDIYNTAINI